jgi:hypothetical protein
VQYIRREDVLTPFERTFRRIICICDRLHTPRGVQNVGIVVNNRRLLAAYMITYYPNHVFETVHGQREQDVIAAAREFIECFDSILAHVSSGDMSPHSIPADKSSVFQGLTSRYLQTFEAWRDPDNQLLVDRIQRALLALVHAKNHTDETEDPHLLTVLDEQIQRLEDKMVELAGAEALALFRANYPPPTAAAEIPEFPDAAFLLAEGDAEAA